VEQWAQVHFAERRRKPKPLPMEELILEGLRQGSTFSGGLFSQSNGINTSFRRGSDPAASAFAKASSQRSNRCHLAKA
jgi:hypothetical protein